MTDVLPAHGGPSQLHEARVETLQTLAALSGFQSGPDLLPGGSRPDVLLLRAGDGAVFVGDAKATETPGNSETFERLSNYAKFLTAWTETGLTAVFALAVDTTDAYSWLRVLRGLSVGPSGGRNVRGRIDWIEAGTAVVWEHFAGRTTGATTWPAQGQVELTGEDGVEY